MEPLTSQHKLSESNTSCSAQVWYDRDKVLRLPRGVHIVVSDWVSASLARGALQREEDHYIDLAKLAALADRPGSHVRGPLSSCKPPYTPFQCCASEEGATEMVW